jgi:tetratricopeptide (TPR) repeat protein
VCELKGFSLFQLKNYADAIDLLDLAIELRPDYESAHYFKGKYP